MFDAPPEEKCVKSYDFDFPWDDEPWNVGLVVGPSGSGKSTILRHVWGQPSTLEWVGAGIVDDFESSIEDVAHGLGSVGLNTIPAWLRPYRVLSMGEQFRAEMARRIMGVSDPIVVDEYTSVVDRQVAQVASHAIGKYVRSKGKRFVAVGCHYDVIDWLQPDWVLDMATCQFQRRRLQRRPSIEITIGRLPRTAWRLFAPFHYMTAKLPPSTHGFGLWANGTLACSAWLAVFPHPKAKDIVRIARIVTLPDWQGLGLAFTLAESLGSALKAGGRRLRNYPAHPAYIDAHKRRSDLWRMVKDQSFGQELGSSGTLNGAGDRFVATFEYVGPSNARFASLLGVTRKLGPDENNEHIEKNIIDTVPSVASIVAPKEEKITVVDNKNLLDFIPALSPEFASPWHLREWCEQIETCLTGGVRALCEIPIRHWKSQTTDHGIAWILKRDPTTRILVMVADDEAANDRGKRIRQLCEAAGVGPERGQNVIKSWRNDSGGGVQMMSAKQSKLGQDVDVLVFDDPLSETDALDKSVRDSVDMAIAHYTARAGRTGRRGSVLGIMSRWHPDDPIGRRLTRQAVDWRRIHAAAITTADDGTERAFAPDVMDLDELHRRRSELREADPTERIWHAQFQNDPQPDALGLFRNPARYTNLPDRAGFRTVIGADLAYSSSKHADYFALIVLKIWPEMIREGGEMKLREVAYVAECRRERWDPAQSEAILRQTRAIYPGAVIYSYMSGPETGIARYLEDKGIPIQILPARYSKRQRAQPAIDLSNAERIRLPELAPWTTGLVSRMMLFSGDERAGDDDEIDALASAVAGGMAGQGFRPKAMGKRRI